MCTRKGTEGSNPSLSATVFYVPHLVAMAVAMTALCVVTSPEYLDGSLPAGATFSHPTKSGHTVFAYVIGGRATFEHQSDPYSYEAEGAAYFDQERDRLIGDRHLVLFGDGDGVIVTAAAEPVRF